MATPAGTKFETFPDSFETKTISTSFGPTMAVVMRAAASNVAESVIPNAGHWLMEEQPAATIGREMRLSRREDVTAEDSDRPDEMRRMTGRAEL
jgi:hypothetical protein